MSSDFTHKFLSELLEAVSKNGKISRPEFVDDSSAWLAVIQTVTRWGMQAVFADAVQKSDWVADVPEKIRLKIDERNAHIRLLNLARRHELETVKKILKQGNVPFVLLGKTALRQRLESRDTLEWHFACDVIELGCFDLRSALRVLGRRGYRSTEDSPSVIELRYGTSPNRIRLYEELTADRPETYWKNETVLDWTVRHAKKNKDWLVSPETLLLFQRELGIDLSKVPKRTGLRMNYELISEAWLTGHVPKTWLDRVSEFRKNLIRIGKETRKSFQNEKDR